MQPFTDGYVPREHIYLQLLMISFLRKIFGLDVKPTLLSAIYLADSAGQPMQRLNTVLVIKDAGLEGDRYCTHKGYWHRVEACQVTLISEEDIQLAMRGNSLNFKNGSHRRNLVVSGLKTKKLMGKTFRIGEAIFRCDKPRPPCGYLNKIEGRGMALALSYNSGVCLSVLQGGCLSEGDLLEIIPSK